MYYVIERVFVSRNIIKAFLTFCLKGQKGVGAILENMCKNNLFHVVS